MSTKKTTTPTTIKIGNLNNTENPPKIKAAKKRYFSKENNLVSKACRSENSFASKTSMLDRINRATPINKIINNSCNIASSLLHFLKDTTWSCHDMMTQG